MGPELHGAAGVHHQGVAVVNYTEREVPYTRIIEHKHFEFGTQPVTYITREYPADWHRGEEAYYPVNNERNQGMYKKYAALAAKETSTIFGGASPSTSTTTWTTSSKAHLSARRRNSRKKYERALGLR